MCRIKIKLTLCFIAAGSISVPAYTQQKVTDAADAPWITSGSMIKETWHGFRITQRNIDKFTMQIAEPTTPAPGTPWVIMISEIGDGFHWQFTEMLLKRGIHVAAINSYNTYGSDYGLALMDSLYTMARKHYKLPEQCGLIGVSRAGLSVYRWAVKFPTRIACIYCEGPVMDFKTWPMKWPPSASNWMELKRYYGFNTDSEAIAYSGNPIDNLRPIAKAKIPIRHVISLTEEHDTKIVPNELNTLKARKILQTMGHDIEIVITPKGEAVPYSSDRASVAFIYTHCQKGVTQTIE